MTSPRNIIRVDHEASHTHAWRVTLQRHNDIVVKTFSDSIYGGKRKALKIAVAYRDERLRQYSPYAHVSGSAPDFVGTIGRAFLA